MRLCTHINLIVALMVAQITLSSCSRNETNVKKETPASTISDEKTQTVGVIFPGKESFVAQVFISGIAKPNRMVTVYAMESGYVQSIFKDIGDEVNEGDVIAQLLNPELSRKYEEIKVQLDGKKSTYDRLNSVYEKTPALIPIQSLEEVETQYLTLKSELGALEDRLNFLKVKAPFSGVITKRLLDAGALVQSGLSQVKPQGIVEIQQIHPIRLSVPLPESDIAAITKGMKVEVEFPELPSAKFEVVVSRIAGALDPESNTMLVEIDIDNQEGSIKPGMYAKVIMNISSRKGVNSLPITAQWIAKNQAFIRIVQEGKVKQVPLRKGLSNKDYFEVLNTDISDSTMVIIQGKGLVHPEQKVKPVSVNSKP